MKANVLGFPRVGEKRELKKVLENYWKGNVSWDAVLQQATAIKEKNWKFQQELGVDLIASNDFSLYDQVLDWSVTLGCIPKRYNSLKNDPTALYFAMARGIQKSDLDLKAMEMTKWFNTNYHYIVPEFSKDQNFELFSTKVVDEYKEAKAIGTHTKPVILGPVTYLLLGKEKETGFHRIELLERLLPVYNQLLEQLSEAGATYIQVDEPCLATNLTKEEKKAITSTYFQLVEKHPKLKFILTSYFDEYSNNLSTVLSLPVHAIHFDISEKETELNKVLVSPYLNTNTILSLGIVNGRNIWKNNFTKSLDVINDAIEKIGKDRIWIGTSCSLLHTPYDLELEATNDNLAEAKQWLAFAKQKIEEVIVLKDLVDQKVTDGLIIKLDENRKSYQNRQTSTLIHNSLVKERVAKLTDKDSQRLSTFKTRQAQQKKNLKLPLYPTTTIGSFPQTKEVRQWRSKLKKGAVTQTAYDTFIANEIEASIRFQEEIGIDVLVHGEFERNDMVEYFGEKLNGFAFTNFGWVQSYGTRCVKPPIIFGDVIREQPMTVKWSKFAQEQTDLPVKGMLTGPVTILQWSFVRDDQPRATTCKQIALAIRDEVVDLETEGISVIQIDEPALREGLPLRLENWKNYLDWAVESFRISASGVADQTQIHTHMCYAEFNDIIQSISDLDADVITIETSRSEMELLNAFVDFKYPNEIGPGVYDIHSPRVPTQVEIENLLNKASDLLPVENIWVNPDCGLKTRDWPETKSALQNLVQVAKKLRAEVAVVQ